MLEIRPLNKELQQYVEEDLNENPETISDNVTYLRDWIKTQDHIKIRTNDQYLVTILRFSKHDLERAKQKIIAISTLRSKYSYLYCNRDPLLPEFQQLLHAGIALPLSKTKNPASYKIILARTSFDASAVKPKALGQLMLMIKDILLLEDDNYSVIGDKLLLDCQDTSIHHMKLIEFGLLKALQKVTFDAYPSYPLGTVIMNAPKLFDITYNKVIKHVIPLQHQKMVQIYSDTPPELYDTVPLSILPEEYGGNGGTIAELIAHWKKKVESYRDWFLEDEQYIDTKEKSKRH